MPSMPNLLTTIATEIYEATSASSDRETNLTTNLSMEEETKYEKNSTNLISTNSLAQHQLKCLVSNISSGKYTFPNLISSSLVQINEETTKNLKVHQPKQTNRKRKKNIEYSESFIAFKNTSILPAVKGSLISPENVVNTHRIRKLKLYTIEEKIDIIDYAKIIGNRAAGREFNVAESSIREWRKNEERLR